MAEPQSIPRWSANVIYRSQAGPVDVRHDFEELEDLQDIIERGPDWNTIEKIEITLARSTGRLTLQASEGGR